MRAAGDPEGGTGPQAEGRRNERAARPPARLTRVGGVDLGSNTIRLLVADGDRVRGLARVHEEQVVTRLGEGLSSSGRLGPAAIERAVAAVRRYRDRARGLGVERLLVVATAAAREAENRDELVARLEPEPGVAFRVVSGEEEARLTLLGVASGLPAEIAAAGAPYAVLDIGGGSTELIVARGSRYVSAVSVRLGVVPLAERFLHADPVDWAEYAACGAHVAERLAAEAWPEIRALRPGTLLGTAGTVTTLAALDLGLPRYDAGRVQGHRLTAAAVRALLVRLGNLHVAERARLPCLEPGRADLIIPGIAVTLAVLEGLGVDALLVSDFGLREGILLDAVGWTAAGGGAC